MPKYRFKGSDEPRDIKRQIEDKYATYETVQQKALKVEDIVYSEPLVQDMQNGDNLIYDDGTNQWEYLKRGGKLFKKQLTGV